MVLHPITPILLRHRSARQRGTVEARHCNRAGRHVANRLAQAGHHVRCLLDPSAAWDESEHWDRNIEWLLGSAYDPASIVALVQDADAVFHVASPPDDGEFEARVIVPMRALLAAYEVGVPRFVYLSPDSAFEIVLYPPGVECAR